VLWPATSGSGSAPPSALSAEAGPEEVALAHALRHPEAAVWAEVRPEAWVGLLNALLRWAQAGGIAGSEVPLPDGLRGQVAGSLDYPQLYGPFRMPLGILVRWLALAVGVQARPAGATTALPAATTGRRSRGPAAGARWPAERSRSGCPAVQVAVPAPPYPRGVIPLSAVDDRSEPPPSEQEKSAALDALGARRPLSARQARVLAMMGVSANDAGQRPERPWGVDDDLLLLRLAHVRHWSAGAIAAFLGRPESLVREALWRLHRVQPSKSRAPTGGGRAV